MWIIEPHFVKWAKQQASIVGADGQAMQGRLDRISDGAETHTVSKDFQEVEDAQSTFVLLFIEFVDLFLFDRVASSLEVRSLEDIVASSTEGNERVALTACSGKDSVGSGIRHDVVCNVREYCSAAQPSLHFFQFCTESTSASLCGVIEISCYGSERASGEIQVGFHSSNSVWAEFPKCTHESLLGHLRRQLLDLQISKVVAKLDGSKGLADLAHV